MNVFLFGGAMLMLFEVKHPAGILEDNFHTIHSEATPTRDAQPQKMHSYLITHKISCTSGGCGPTRGVARTFTNRKVTQRYASPYRAWSIWVAISLRVGSTTLNSAANIDFGSRPFVHFSNVVMIHRIWHIWQSFTNNRYDHKFQEALLSSSIMTINKHH